MSETGDGGPVDRDVGRPCECMRCAKESNDGVWIAGLWVPRENGRMFVCAICGNKRCPHSDDHRNACTGSNDPGQPGSRYTATVDPRKPCTCDGAGRGPGRVCGVQRGQRLGDLWRCVRGLTPNAEVTGRGPKETG